MEIADSLGGKLTCGAKTKETDGVKNVSDDELEDVIEPDIDVGTYDDIVDESEKAESLDVKPFRGFMIDQLLGK